MTGEDLFVLFGFVSTAALGAVIIAAVLAGWCRSLWDWWRGVEPPEQTWTCFECGEELPSPGILCDKCAEPQPAKPRWAHLLDRDDVMVLDTQTTGLDADAEVVDVAVINTRGRVMLHDLRAHGASSYVDVHEPLMSVLARASIICVYNEGFDMQMIRQSAERHGLDATIDASVVCIMEEYANHYTTDGRWPKLTAAARLEGVKVGGTRHRPLTDARLTLGLIRAVVTRDHSRRGGPRPAAPALRTGRES